MISQFMFSSSAIIFTLNLQLDHSSSFICTVLSSVHVVDGHLLRCLSATRFLASENILCQQKGFTVDIVSSPKACQSLAYVVMAFSLSLTQKIMAYHRTIFRASILTRFTNKSSRVKHLLHIEALHGHASVSGDWGDDRGKMWSVLAGCIIANTTRKKSVSLLHCKITYSLRMLHHGVCLVP